VTTATASNHASEPPVAPSRSIEHPPTAATSVVRTHRPWSSHAAPGVQSSTDPHEPAQVPVTPHRYGAHEAGSPPPFGIDERPSLEHLARSTHAPPSHS
jgi:hypothetical protein